MNDMPEQTEQQVVLYGYSERGMVNALSDDILRSDPPLKAVSDLLSWCKFPFQADTGLPDFSDITKATVLVEQGFSDFGDLDFLILLDHPNGRKNAVLLEAKVRTDTTSPKRIRDQWQAFFDYLGGDKKKRSTLFVQLYRKMRLIRQLDNLTIQLPGDGVARRWSLGANRVVLKAAELLAGYRSSPWYIALVPDAPEVVDQFYTGTLLPFTPPPNLPEWTQDNIKRWGYLTWPTLDVRCRADQATWARTVPNFDWNKHQIYEIPEGPAPANELPIEVGRGYGYMGSVVYVVFARAGDSNCLIVTAAPLGDYFPATVKVAKTSLQQAQEPAPVLLTNLRPRTGEVYRWEPPAQEAHNPDAPATIPQPPQQVKIVRHGWTTSEVRQVDGRGIAQGTSFHVFTRHVRRA